MSRFAYVQGVAQRRRPGVVTTVGVLGIAASIASIVVSLACLMGTMVFNLASQRHNQVLKITSSAVVAVESNQENQRGLDEASVSRAIEGLGRRVPLSTRRAEQARKILSNYGREILLLGDSVTASGVERMVSDCGPIMETSQFYELGTGRLEVSDRQATFRPTAANSPTLRSSDVPHDRSLTEAQIQAVLNLLDPSVGELTPGQDNALRQLLRDPRQTAITLQGELPVIYGSYRDANFGLVIRTATCQIHLPLSGEANVLPPTTPLAGTSVFPSPNPVNRTWAALAMAESALAILLAIVMIVALTMLLRGRPVGRRLTLATALAKILLAILAAVAWGGLTSTAMNAQSNRPGGAPVYPAVGLGLVVLLVGCAHAVFAVMALMSKSGKGYFKGVM